MAQYHSLKKPMQKNVINNTHGYFGDRDLINNKMDLKELIIDIDYQKHYSYDKRIDLFNKYQISPSSKFFVPIWELAQFIIGSNMANKKVYFFAFGHGQNILNRSLNKNIADKKELRISLSNTGRSLIIRRYVPDAKELPTYGKYRNAIIFNLEDKCISVCGSILEVGQFKINRDLYDLIDQWLVDFGFNKW